MRAIHGWLHRLGPTGRAILWSMLAGLLFALLNTIMKSMSAQLGSFQTQFLRYLFGTLVMMPFLLRSGWLSYRPHKVMSHVWRGMIHCTGIILWFLALPKIPLADTVAIGFTGPLFVMVGAAWFLGEKMVKARWIAALIGFFGVMIVVGPKLTVSGGWYNLVMLASAPVFAVSMLMSKALTRNDSPQVIVLWQSLVVTALSLPLALSVWVWPTPMQWFLHVIAGILGSLGHYCLNRSLVYADISATQPIKFLDLIWAMIAGFILWGDEPSQATVLGSLVILGAIMWISRHETRRGREAAAMPDPARDPGSGIR